MSARTVMVTCLGAILLASFTIRAASQTPLLRTPNVTAEQRRLAAREGWFLRGRTAPPGQSSAEFRQRAHAFKLRKRARATRALSEHGASAFGNSVASGWRSIGPAPLASDASGFGLRDYSWVSGRATSVAIDPADASGNTLYVGGAYGGIWKSSNATAPAPSSVVWTPLLDDQATLSVGSIALKPGGDGTILIGTGETNSSTDSYYGLGILRSSDSGRYWTLISSSTDGRSFKGMGFSKIAFSTDDPSLAVAAAGAAAQGTSSGLDMGGNRGIYASADAGQSWRFASIKDGATSITASSVTSVVYNASSKKFIAAIRRHGFYSSTDGLSWTRLVTQPGGPSGAGTLGTTACPPDAAMNAFACPIYRGEIAVVPGRDEVYAWFMDLPGNSSPETDRGIWRSVDGGPWAQISSTGITSCGDASGCGATHGDYSLAISAVPNGSVATDLYAGALNLYRCQLVDGGTSTICSGGAWLNLTHAYGCSDIAKVHPSQHAIQFLVASGKAVGYFANDGGIYRTLDGFTGLGAGLNGACNGTNQFDSLNQTLGSMTQLVGFAQHPTDLGTFLVGAQGNGFPATNQAAVSSSFVNVLSGDGGYTAITPSESARWLASTPDVPPGGLNIRSCEFGIDCRSGTFSTVVESSDLSGDDGAYYLPYILDPRADGQLLIGTCRVWRAAADRSTFAVLSNNFDTGSGGCTGYEVNQVRALAAGGPQGSHGFSNVVYATTEGYGPLLGPTSPPGGRVYVSTNADSANPSFSDVTGAINPQQYPISAVALDSSDPTGKTAFVTVMGFGGEHVFKTATSGETWTPFGGIVTGLPDLPANSVLVDADSGDVYVGTDAGVFVSPKSTPHWVEVGAQSGVGHLPNVPVTSLRMFYPTPGTKKLRASTYGRGLWEFNLIVTPDFQILVSNPSATIFAGQQALLNGLAIDFNGYGFPADLSCAGSVLPTTCSPNPSTVIPTETGAPFSITASGAPGVYPFNVRAIGSDGDYTTRNAPVTLKVVDFGISEINPSSISVTRSGVSTPMTFVVSAYGPFDGIVALSCPTGLPLGASCIFSPSAAIMPTAGSPVGVTLTVATGSTTPIGTFPVLIQTSVAGAPAPRSATVTLVVTSTPDYTFTINNSPLALTVDQAGEFVGTLTGISGYSSTVAIACGAGAPISCSGGSFTPTPTGTAFHVSVTSALAETYHFDITASGSDSAATQHSIPVILIISTDFSMTTGSGTQTINAGETASYFLDVTASEGSLTNSVSFTCEPMSLPPLSHCTFEPPVIPAASDSTTVRLNIATTGAIAMLGMRGRMLFYALSLPFLALASLDDFRKKRKKTTTYGSTVAFLSLVLLTAALLSACGGGMSEAAAGHPGTPPGSYHIQVSATSGSVLQQLTVTLVVQ